MNFNLQITHKQALVIAKRITSSNYGIAMYGWFDMYLDEIAEIIMLSVNTKTDKEAKTKLDNYYKYLLNLRERGE